MKKHNFNLCVNDTDSISFSKKDGSPISKKERAKLLGELNGLMQEGILWEDDDYFKKVIAVAAKNYVLDNGDKIKIKGSALKATKKEPALKKFIKDVIDLLLADELDQISDLYTKYVKRILAIDSKTDITDWSFKVTATKKVLEPTTVFNKKILDALIKARIDVVEGDKYYMYFKPFKTKQVTDKKTGKLKNQKIQKLAVTSSYQDDICKMTLLKKLFVTAKIFHRVYDIKTLPNLTLKRSQAMLQDIQKATKRTQRG